MNDISIGKSGLKLPIIKIIEALPRAMAAERAKAADDHDADSPGGAKTTAGEAAEDVCAFFAALAQEVLPDVLEANGIG